MQLPFNQEISTHISRVVGHTFQAMECRRIAGGCINQTLHLSNGGEHYFVKLNQADRYAMFVAERKGLNELASSDTMKIPTALCDGIIDNHAYLVMEYIDLQPLHPGSMALAGRQLATMHRITNKFYGWEHNNFIGTTLQPNQQTHDWPLFWQEQRLGHQLQLAAQQGYCGCLQDRGSLLLSSLAKLLDHQPLPSLLHGDLWSGNIGSTVDGTPVLFDPAIYYGDREADLAMTELFGGLSADFYAAYQETWPLDAGYPIRKRLYNLYHILNHLILFGGSYQQQSEEIIEQLLAELG